MSFYSAENDAQHSVSASAVLAQGNTCIMTQINVTRALTRAEGSRLLAVVGHICPVQ